MKNLSQMLKQAQKVQEEIAALQERLSELTVTGRAGGGMVEATVSGKGELKKLKIDPKLMTPEDAEMLEDLIVAAVNDGHEKAQRMAADEMAKMAGGLQLPPGFTLPI